MPRRFLFLLGILILIAFQKTEAQNIVFDTIGNTILTADTIVKETKTPKAKAKKPHQQPTNQSWHPFTTLHPTHTLRWPPRYRISEHEANACIRKWHYSWITYKNMDNL